MATRPRRVLVLALAFLLAACGAQVAAPRPTESPSPTAQPAATPRPTNAANDVLYVRSIGAGGQGSVLVIDARTGATKRTMPDGAISADGSTLFWPELVDGATRTRIHVTDLGTGAELRSFSVAGALQPTTFTGSVSELNGRQLSADGRFLALRNLPYKDPYNWVTRLVVVDTTSGAVSGSIEVAARAFYVPVAVSPDGRFVFLDELGEGPTPRRTKAFAVASAAIVDVAGPALSRNGFLTPGVFSPDGRWMFRVDTGDHAGGAPAGPAVVAVDLVGAHTRAIPLVTRPTASDQAEFWSLALAPDGASLYAANPAMGMINEVDTRQLAVRRSAEITTSRAGDGVFERAAQLLFPVAEAKRFPMAGAVVSPDGRTLYAVSASGIAVIDTATLRARESLWRAGYLFEHIAMSSDGARLYAADTSTRNLIVFDARAGTFQGSIGLTDYVPTIVRIDSAP